MSSFFERLKEERERLGLNQTAFGAIGGVGKQAQIKYENGSRAPDAVYLSAIAASGADVQYILIGVRSAVITDVPVVDAQASPQSKALKEAMKIANELPEDVHRDILEHVKGRRRDTEREQALQDELERLGGGAGNRSA